MIIDNIEFETPLIDILQDLQGVLASNGIHLLGKIKESGENIMCSCPYHSDGQERHSSFGIKKSDGVGHCFACGKVVDLPEMVSNCFGKNDAGAFGWQWLLKNYVAVETESRHYELNLGNTRNSISGVRNSHYVSEEELDSYRYIHPYLAKRGIVDEHIIELFDLGYDADTHSITFPIRDKEGHCLFIARRSVRSKFFHYPEGVVKPLYGLHELWKVSTHNDYKVNITDKGHIRGLYNIPEVFVCESMIDCILLWQAGYYAVALNGLGNKLALKQLQDLPCRTLVLATDMDKAGQDARKRIKSIIKNKLFLEVFLPNGRKDIGECTPEELAQLCPQLV